MRTLKKWLKPSKHINYTDKILRSIIKTSYAKKKLSSLLLMLITIIVRLVIDVILSIIINSYINNVYIDFWIQITVSIILVLGSNWIYKLVERFDRDIYGLTKYLVDNYTAENYRKWKRNITFGMCILVIIYLQLSQLTSNILILYVIQYMICYIVIDLIENKYNNLLSPTYGPYKAVYTYDDDFKLPENSPISPPSISNDNENKGMDDDQKIPISPKYQPVSDVEKDIIDPNAIPQMPRVLKSPKPPELGQLLNDSPNKNTVRNQRSLSQSGYTFDDDVSLGPNVDKLN